MRRRGGVEEAGFSGGEMRLGSRRSNSAARCPLITWGDFCWGVGGGFFPLSDWFILRLCIWWAPEWWRLITNTWARSAEDPHRAGINYSLPCLWKSRDCYQLRGTFFFFLVPSFLLGIWRQSLTPNVCWCCWSGTKHKLQSKLFLPPSPLLHIVHWWGGCLNFSSNSSPLPQINKLVMKKSASDLL